VFDVSERGDVRNDERQRSGHQGTGDCKHRAALDMVQNAEADATQHACGRQEYGNSDVVPRQLEISDHVGLVEHHHVHTAAMLTDKERHGDERGFPDGRLCVQ